MVFFKYLPRQKGLEPLTYCLEGSCSIQLSYWRRVTFVMEQMMGIEPTRSAWKAEVLPLNYICISLCNDIYYITAFSVCQYFFEIFSKNIFDLMPSAVFIGNSYYYTTNFKFVKGFLKIFQKFFSAESLAANLRTLRRVFKYSQFLLF